MSAAVLSETSRWPLRLGQLTLIGWLAYLLVAPTIGFSWIDSWHNEQRAVQVVLLAWTALVFATLVIFDGAALRVAKGVAPLLAAFVLLGAASAARSAHPLAAFAEISMLVLLAALAVLTAIVSAAAPERTAAIARYFALLFCAAYSLGVAVRLFAALQLGHAIGLDVLVFGYANPRFPSAFHVALLPFVALVAVDERETRSLRIAAVVVMAAVWGINWGLGTRGIWFAYLLALPTLALLVGWRRLTATAGALALAAIVGVACFELLLQLTAPAGSDATAAARPVSNMTLTSREVLWSLSWHAIVDSPLLGIGPMQFAALGSQVGAHPHNWVLQGAAEWGLPAALILGGLVFLLAAGMRQRTSPFGIAVSCSLLASLTLALVDGNLVMPITQTAFALAIGLYLGLPGSSPSRGNDRPVLARALAASALAASICLAIYAVSSFSAHETARDDFLRANPGVWLLPRFWEHSLF